MSRNLEDLIRRWGCAAGDEPPAQPPAAECLSFPQAEALARSGPAGDADLLRHAACCRRCARLVADFREALAEQAPAGQPGAAEGDRQRIVRLTRRYFAWAAAAAAVALIATSAFLLLQGGPGGPVLETVELAIRDPSGGDYVPRSGAFATGDQIIVRVRLHRPGYLAVINLDPRGELAALPPAPSAPSLSPRVKGGETVVGPYPLDDSVGTETLFIVAAGRPIGDLDKRLSDLRAAHAKGSDAQSLAEMIRSWPAEVQVIQFRHEPARN